MPISLILRILWPLVLAAFAFGLGWKVCTWRYQAQEAKALNTIAENAKAQDDVNAKDSKVRIEKQVVYQKSKDEDNKNVIKEVIKVPVYSECIVPLSGVRIINGAVSAANKVKSTDGFNGSL